MSPVPYFPCRDSEEGSKLEYRGNENDACFRHIQMPMS